jgi:anaerobic carbon-monoxide dehydrogenase iron sulfur subunit
MPSVKFTQRKFVSVDPSKCTGCGICEYACSTEKGEAGASPLRSRIRVVRMKPLFNVALACRACEDAKCVTACPEKALSQAENTGVIMVNDKKCKGCDWCVQACPHGGISIHSDTGLAVACDLCSGTPQCVENCPEEALELVATDEEADNRTNETINKLPQEAERIANIVKNKDWKPVLAEAEKRSEKVTEKLEAINKKAQTHKHK